MASAARKIKLYNLGELHLYEAISNGTSKIVLRAPSSLAADRTFILPAVDGAAGNALTTDGAGGLSFAAAIPAAHATTHKDGGSDEVATTTPGAGAIPKAGGGGTLAAGWIAGVLASTDLTDSAGLERTANKNAASGYAGLDGSSKLNGAQQVYGSAGNTACEGNDSRLSDARTPTSHASTHQNGGGDEVATATPANNAIPKAGGTGKLAAGWISGVLASSDLTNDAALEKTANKAAASGYASLDAGTLVPVAQLGGGSPDSTKFLDGSRTFRILTASDVPASITGGRELAGQRHAGGGSLEVWYIAGVLGSATLAAGGSAPTADVLHAFPFISPRGGRLDRIEFEITTVGGASSKMRVGFYAATSEANLYPDSLLFESGEIATNSGTLKSTTISQALTAGKLYWAFVLATGGGGSVASIRTVGQNVAILGYPSTLGSSTPSRSHLTVAQSYGTPPSTFPASATMVNTGNAFVIAVRFDQ